MKGSEVKREYRRVDAALKVTAAGALWVGFRRWHQSRLRLSCDEQDRPPAPDVEARRRAGACAPWGAGDSEFKNLGGRIKPGQTFPDWLT